jgi:hypothetical protein
MHPIKLLALGAWLALLTACAPIFDFVPTNPAPRPLRKHHARDVEVFSTAPNDRQYIEIGMIEVFDNGLQNMQGVIEDLREFAAERHCDGVVTFAKGDSAVGGASCILFLDTRH